MTDDTTLSDLLELNLHEFEDEVHNIVDKACKEMAMEKMLKDLNAHWNKGPFNIHIYSQCSRSLMNALLDVFDVHFD